MKKNLDEVLDIFIEEIKKFLVENGGMRNGYETKVQGHVSPRVRQSLEIFTPRFGDLTYNEIKRKGRDLNDILRKVLEDNEIEKEIKIDSVTDYDGCSKIFVSYEIEKKLDF